MQFTAFASIIAFALVGTTVTAQGDLSKRVRIDYLWSSIEVKYSCRRVTLPVAHATMRRKVIYFAAPQMPTPIVSQTIITLVTLMEVPPIAAIRSLAPAAAQPRAEVVVQICSL